jgi:hypothetical protein
MSTSASQPRPAAPGDGSTPQQQAAAAVEAHRVGLETVQQAAEALNARQQRWEAIREAASAVREQARGVEALGQAARALQGRLQRLEKLRGIATPRSELTRRLRRIDELHLDALGEAITATLAADALQAADPRPIDQREILAAAGIELDANEPPAPERLAEETRINQLIDAAGRAEEPGLRLALLQLAIGLVGLFIDEQLGRASGPGGGPLREAEAVRAVRKHVRRQIGANEALRSGQVVARDNLRAHRAPDAGAPAVATLRLGTVVRRLEKRKHWARIRCGEAGGDGEDSSGKNGSEEREGQPIDGWVRSKYLKPLNR